MSNMFAKGSEMIERVRSQALVQSVTYQSGIHSITINATPSRTRRNVTDESGMVLVVEQPDWIVSTGDLVINSVLVHPAIGDLITMTVNGTTEVYEVAPFPGESHWRFTDLYANSIRIHTIAVGSL